MQCNNFTFVTNGDHYQQVNLDPHSWCMIVINNAKDVD